MVNNIMASGSPRKVKANLAGLEIIELILKKKKPEVAFWRPTEKYKSPISKFHSPEVKGAAKR